MEKMIISSASRGVANHGWLHSFHTFSFADYYNPQRMGFGALRVINDDRVAPKMGFPTHSHRDMEIISIPLKGSLKHKDSEGNERTISSDEVQIMSAGTGVAHSEYNGSHVDEVSFLQIWVIPEKQGIKPRYDQKKFPLLGRKNQWQRIVSPIGTEDETVKINQQAYFSLAELDAEKILSYDRQLPSNGIFIFNLEGTITVGENILSRRDSIGIQDVSRISIESKENSQVLIMEVPV